MGDLNVHHLSWLRFSISTQPAGTALYNLATEHGLIQCVQGPTREQNLLDLVLSDLDAYTQIKILPRISDHNLVHISIALSIPCYTPIKRNVWNFKNAN